MSAVTYARAYELASAANARKEAQVRELLPHYQAALQKLFDYNLRLLKQGELCKPRWLTAAELHRLVSSSALSQRQLKSVSNHANQIFASYLTSIEQRVRDYITYSSLEDEQRKTLYRVNLRHEWYVKEQSSSLLRSMIKHAFKITRYPVLTKIRTMNLDGAVAQVQTSKDTKYDYWVRVSTLSKGNPVLIPLRSNQYFERKPGRTANFVQVHVGEAKLTFRLVKHAALAAPRTDASVLGVDFGMVTLFTDSTGGQYGKALYPWLQRIDQQLVSLTSQLQVQRVPLRTNKRYQAFQHRIREYVANEINRCLNKLAAKASTLIVEKLDFRHGGLSKRLNRLLTRFGRSAVRSKLVSLLQEQGVDHVEVNAAYTSQECSGCGNVAKENRLSQAKFRCLFCGRALHADVNGARTVEKRFLSGNVWLFVKRAVIKQKLDELHRSRWNLPSAASLSTA